MTAVTKERKPRTKKEKRAMPVSEKFYMDMMMRINSVLPSPENREVIVMMCKHINGIPFNPDDFGALSEVAYMLLLPEIDRAMARSRAARERARKRKLASEYAKTEDEEGQLRHDIAVLKSL